MEIRPFRGWRYRADGGELGDVLAPPYDVLTADDKDELLARDEHNIVAVDLPHVPPVDVGADEVYEQAAALLQKWHDEGVIQQEARDAIYVYHQSYTWAGRTHTRRGMICSVRADEMGKDIIPHEHTFAGPKADRLKLTEHTGMQLSPIFGFYDDPGGEVSGILSAFSARAPAARAVLNGVTESLWVITDAATVGRIAELLADAPVFIADGHHRCTTAMNYRSELAARGEIDENHPANFVMFVLVARDDPGLLVLPTHRLISGLSEDFSLARLIRAAGEFSWQRLDTTDADFTDADAMLSGFGPGAMAFVGAGAEEVWIGKLADPQAMVSAAPDEGDPWRRLSVSILHKLIISKALEPWHGDGTRIEYTAFAADVLAACKSRSAQLGICLQATPVEAVEEIALAGAFMPHKSTYFYPKLATGIVWKPMHP